MQFSNCALMVENKFKTHETEPPNEVTMHRFSPISDKGAASMYVTPQSLSDLGAQKVDPGPRRGSLSGIKLISWLDEFRGMGTLWRTYILEIKTIERLALEVDA